ncbi:MAG: hypothetical protein AAFO76_05750 [Cyanobacteria bacterium J06607_15]
MKRITSICLGVSICIASLSIAASTTAAHELIGKHQHLNPNLIAVRSAATITPYNLVSQAYQGNFRSLGVPSSGGFIAAIRANRINADKLVEIGVAMGRLDESYLTNESYKIAVENVLDNTINTN